MKKKLRNLTAQECVEYAAEKSRDLPEPLRLQVYWGTLIALMTDTPRPIDAEPRLSEWQIARFGDYPETRAAIAFWRERGWPVDDQRSNPELDQRIRDFYTGWREAMKQVGCVSVTAGEASGGNHGRVHEEADGGLVAVRVHEAQGWEVDSHQTQRPERDEVQKVRHNESGDRQVASQQVADPLPRTRDTEIASEDLAREACAIAAHQLNGRVHPLTCGIDSRHAPLVPSVEDDRIVLRCLGSMTGLTPVSCDYRQTWNPLKQIGSVTSDPSAKHEVDR